jgi:hypothetical protein
MMPYSIVYCDLNDACVEQSDSNTLACSYAALILHDEGLPINVENLNKIIKASSVEVESFWPGMFAKALSAAKVSELLATVGTGKTPYCYWSYADILPVRVIFFIAHFFMGHCAPVISRFLKCFHRHHVIHRHQV